MAERLGLTILGGYLGAGKTTWARHQLRQGAFGSRVAVLVNEAAGTAVDDALLPGAVTLLAGGCACCTGLPRLIAALRAQCDLRSRGAGPDHVLLETSGLADPGAIARAIAADPVLLRHMRLSATLVVVDAAHGAAQLARDALARRQVAAADRLILTKTEGLPAATTAALRGLLARLNPTAPQEGASHGLAAPLPPADPAALPAPVGDLPLTLAEVVLPEGLDWTAFALWLSALLAARGEDLLRVKGVVATPAGRLLLQAVRKTVQPPEILPGPPAASDGTLVFFGHGIAAGSLGRSLARFAAA